MTIFDILNQVQNYVLRLTQNPSVAEDILQETYLRWLTNQKSGKNTVPAEKIRAWIYRTARNLAMDYFRQKKKSKDGEAGWFERALARGIADGPETTVERKEEMEHLLKQLERLPAKHQEAVRLKFQERLSYDEIAEVLGEPRTTVAWILHEAVCKLRKAMGAV